MSNYVSDIARARISKAKTLHDLVRKPYKGNIPSPSLTTVDRVAMLLMGSDGYSAVHVERLLGISFNQFNHALFALDNDPHIIVRRKPGKFGNTQLYYI